MRFSYLVLNRKEEMYTVKNLVKRSCARSAGIYHLPNLTKLKRWVSSYQGLLLIILLSILVVRVWSLNIVIRPSDDGWLMYDVFLMAQGKIPYGDFLYSKPPLYLVMLFLFSEAFGYGYVQAKFFSYFLVTMTVIAIYVCASELFNEKIGIIAAFLGSTSIILITNFLMLNTESLSTLLFLVSVIFLIKYLKKGIKGSKRDLYLITAGFFLGATLLVRQTTWILVVFALPFILTIGGQSLRITTVRPQKSRSNKGIPILLALWAIMILFSTTLQLLGWGSVIPTSIFLGGFLLSYLFFLIKNNVEEKRQFKESTRKAIIFGVGMVSLPIILLVWLIHSGVALPLLIFNTLDVPSYDTSIVYHKMLVKQANAVLFAAMNPLLTVGVILYIALAIKAFFSERQKLYSIDNMLGLFIVIGSLSITILLPKFYSVYLMDVVPFIAIGAARAFSQFWRTQGLVRDLRLRSTKIPIKMKARRRQMLLLGLCMLVIIVSITFYYPLAVYSPVEWKDNYESTRAVVDYIRAHTRPDEKVFTINHIFAALSQRRIVGDVSTGIQIRSAWHLNGFPYATPQKIIDLMHKGEGKYVIMDPVTFNELEHWAPDLLEYIMHAYTVEKVIQDIEIMRRTS